MRFAQLAGWSRKHWFLATTTVFFASSLLATRGWIGFLTHKGAQAVADLAESRLIERITGLSGSYWSASVLGGGGFGLRWSTQEIPEEATVPVSSSIAYAAYDYGRKHYLTASQYQITGLEASRNAEPQHVLQRDMV